MPRYYASILWKHNFYYSYVFVFLYKYLITILMLPTHESITFITRSTRSWFIGLYFKYICSYLNWIRNITKPHQSGHSYQFFLFLFLQTFLLVSFTLLIFTLGFFIEDFAIPLTLSATNFMLLESKYWKILLLCR